MRKPLRRSHTASQRTVSVQGMQRIDHAAIHSVGIPRLLLMEHAGLAVARAVQAIIPNPPQPIFVCCGSGYNGGDGLCAARHLVQRNYEPRVVLVGSGKDLKEEPTVYLRILQALQVPLVEIDSLDALDSFNQDWVTKASLLIDALLGIGLQGPVRPLYARLINLMNRAKKPIVAVDVPSGLDADTGLPQGIAVKATVTVTFGLPKHGLVVGQGPEYAGEVIVDDIGIPAALLGAA